jgi:hypothetical protein
MPNRILKESICTSDNIDVLTPFQETVFYRLIVSCDDFGRMDARPKLLSSVLFPLKDIRTAQIEDALRALTSAELVTLYTVGGKPFLQMNTWDRHQRIRDSKAKYPGMDEADAATCGDSRQVAATRGDLRQLAATRGDSRPESESNPNPIQLESESESDDSATASAAPAVAELPLIDGSVYAITEDEREKDAASFPAVDVMQQYREMARWLDSNPKNRKTRNGIRRFINSWLSREQDKAPRVRTRTPGQAYNPFADALREDAL